MKKFKSFSDTKGIVEIFESVAASDRPEKIKEHFDLDSFRTSAVFSKNTIISINQVLSGQMSKGQLLLAIRTLAEKIQVTADDLLFEYLPNSGRIEGIKIETHEESDHSVIHRILDFILNALHAKKEVEEAVARAKQDKDQTNQYVKEYKRELRQENGLNPSPVTAGGYTFYKGSYAYNATEDEEDI